MLGTLVTRHCYPIGCTPIVGSAPDHAGIPLSGFVVLGQNHGEVVITKPEKFTYETTISSIREFLAAFPVPDGKQLYMILDNAPWHKKAKRLIRDDSNPEYIDIREKVIFLDIPPYSPDLNPIEQLWRHTRREITHNRYFASLALLEKKLDEWFAKFKTASEKIASMCTFNFFKKHRKPKRRLYVGMSIYQEAYGIQAN